MRRRLATLGALALSMGLAPSAKAQLPTLPAQADSGTMVRMYTATSMTRGRLLAPFRAGDALLHYCRYPGSPCLGSDDSAAYRTITVGSIMRLDVSPGTHWKRGAVIGGVVGAVVGALGTAFLYSLCEYECRDHRTAIIALGGASSGLTFGALGALWGSAFPRWETPR